VSRRSEYRSGRRGARLDEATLRQDELNNNSSSPQW